MKIVKIAAVVIIVILGLFVIFFADYFEPQSWPFDFWAGHRRIDRIEKKVEKQQVEVKCEECKGTGKLVQNYTELIATARCQLYFASHLRTCKICKVDTEVICKEAEDKINGIMDEAKKKDQDIQEGECPYCQGGGSYIMRMRKNDLPSEGRIVLLLEIVKDLQIRLRDIEKRQRYSHDRLLDIERRHEYEDEQSTGDDS